MARTDLSRIIRLLVISESEAVSTLVDHLCDMFGEDRYVVRRFASVAALPEDQDGFDAVLLDVKSLRLGGTSNADGLVQSVGRYGPVIALTGNIDRPTEQALRRSGAADCLLEEEATPRALRRSIRYVMAVAGAGQKRGLPHLFDAPTGLATQFLFWEILGLAARRARRNKDFFALLLIELEDLPQAGSDGLGDSVMQVAAERASAVLRASDTVARFEHHQLAILVESMPRVEDIQIVAEKIVQELSKSFEVGERDQRFPVNIGISLFPTSADNADSLIGKAFEALASAKGRGKDQFVFA
jgi:diguanylate cyclase (GGDEF)-like protein